MPGMDGWALARRLRDIGHDQAKILMLSANVGETSATPSEDTAHDAMMAKPFNLRQLLDRVQTLLKIVWIEADRDQRLKTPSLDAITNPGAEHVAELLRLGGIGYVRGIEAKLDELEMIESNRRFVEELRRLGRNFDFRRCNAVLEAIAHDE